MPLEFSPRQWRALAALYHLYVPAKRDTNGSTAAGGEERAVIGTDPAEEDEAVQWVEGILPFLQRAFPHEMSGELNRRLSSRVAGRKRRRMERWRELIPDALDILISGILKPSVTGGESTFSLSTNERILLRLLNKEQRLADRCYQRFFLLKERVRCGGEALVSMTREYSNDNMQIRNANNDSKDHGNDGHIEAKKTDLSPVVDSGARCMKNEKLLFGTAGKLKKTKNTAKPDCHLGDDELNCVVSSGTVHNVSAGKKEVPLTYTQKSNLMVSQVEFICVGCGEKGGDLFRCRHCCLLRHEACGGPSVESDTGFCVACCHELGLSFSSGTLRSTTSTEERAELGDYDDDSSSLSGFIVNSSEESESTTTTSSSSSSSSSLPEFRSKEQEKGKRRLPLSKKKKQ